MKKSRIFLVIAVLVLLGFALRWSGSSPPEGRGAPDSPGDAAFTPAASSDPSSPEFEAAFDRSANDASAASSDSAQSDGEADLSELPDLDPGTLPATIKGWIWRSDEGSLEGSRVVLLATGRPGAPIDAEGFFEIQTRIERGVDLLLEHEGVLVLLDVKVRPLPGKEVVVEIEVDAGHELTIEVIDQRTRRPIPDLKIDLRHSTNAGQGALVIGRTDERGFCRFLFLPAGDYRLEIDVDSYLPIVDSLRVPEIETQLVELRAASKILVHLENYELHPPQESLLVYLSPADRAAETSTARSLSGSPDETGSFTTRSPGAGRWNYHVLGSPSFPRVSGEFEIPASDRLSSGQVPTVTIVLPPPGDVTVVGKLVDRSGEPIVGGVVHFGLRSSPVDETGEFVVEGVKVGSAEPRWVRGDGNDRVERPLGEIEIPDQYLFEHTFAIAGAGQLTMWVEGAPEEMLSGLFSFSVERVDGGEPKHSSYGVRGAHQKLTLDYLPSGRYLVQPTIAHRGVILLSSREVEVGAEPVELVVEYRDPATWSFDFEFPATIPAPQKVTVVLERNDRYVDTYFLQLVEGRASQISYLEGSYRWVFKAAGCQDVVRTFEVEPELDRSVSIRFEALP